MAWRKPGSSVTRICWPRLNGWFGTSLTDLDDAVAVLLEPVRAYDKNGNNFVCAFSLRGTRAYIGDPNYALYSFGTQDDKERGN